MNTPTPRTDASWSATFDGEQMSAGQTARALRECSQQLETELATLTAEVERLRSDRDCEKRLRKDADEFRENAIACAEKAEAELATQREKAERYRLAMLKLDGELASERERLDWVFRNCKVTADDFTTGNRDVYAIHDREDLGAAMKEGAK